MIKSTLPLTMIALASLGMDREWGPAQSGERPQARADLREVLHLKEESVTLQYTASKHEATLLVKAEAETSLARIDLRTPGGRPLLRMEVGDGEEYSLQGFDIETRETTLDNLLGMYPEGRYDMRAWTKDGRIVTGQARLTHDLLEEPALIYPRPGAQNVPTNLTVGWVRDERAVRYQVILEQNENDGLVVELPGESSSLVVPPGVLAPGTLSHVEIAAIGPNGNCTLTEAEFTTR